MRHRLFESPTGLFAPIQNEDGSLRTTWLAGRSDAQIADSKLDRRLLPELSDRIKRYFDGEHVGFADVQTPEGPEFNVKCWSMCRKIPRGQTRSYAQLSILAGSNAAGARAAGQAMRNNPLPVIVPCHRVIGADGKLHGFGGSSDADGRELAIKRALLTLEGAAAAFKRESSKRKSDDRMTVGAGL
jgi:methylated-DNA-[protein]-cysteine S-methyltransferase